MSIWRVLETLCNEAAETEFAFLVLNQPILCSSTLIKFLWTKARIRALADGGSNRWLDFITKERGSELPLPCFISGDFDSILPSTKTYFECRGVRFVPTPDQDETDFTKALKCIADFLNDSKTIHIDHVFVLCETGGRLDHIMANINTLVRAPGFLPSGITVFMLSSQNITWVLPPGDHVITLPEEHVTRKYSCGLIPICGATVMTTSGLKWNLNGDVCEFGELISTSNTFVDTTVKISSDGYVVWTTEYSQELHRLIQT